MKRTALFFMFIGLFSFCSCNSHKKQELNNNVISVFDIKSEDFKPKSIRVIPLQTTESSLLGDRLKLIQTNDSDIYVGDFTSRKKVFLFNKDGKFKRTIGHIGQGPKEYISFSDFTVYNDTISVLSDKGLFSNIYSYSSNGEFISNIKLDIGAPSFSRVGSAYLLSTSYNPKMFSHRLYVINLEGKKTASFLPYSNKKFSMVITEYSLGNTNSQILYRQAFDRFAYIYKNGQLQKKYEFDFGKYAIPESFYEDSFMTGFMALNKNGFGTLRHYFESPKYAVFEVDIQNNTDPLLIEYIVLNKKTKHLKRYSYTEKNKFWGQLAGVSGNDELIFMTFPHQILDNVDKFEKYPIRDKERLRKIKLDDNPVLFYCALKTE